MLATLPRADKKRALTRDLPAKVRHVITHYRFRRRTSRGYISVTNCEGKGYIIRIGDDVMVCDCPDSVFVQQPFGTACKHIRSIFEIYH